MWKSFGLLAVLLPAMMWAASAMSPAAPAAFQVPASDDTVNWQLPLTGGMPVDGPIEPTATPTASPTPVPTSTPVPTATPTPVPPPPPTPTAFVPQQLAPATSSTQDLIILLSQYPWSVDEALYVISKESNFDPNVWNFEGSGACGLFQLLPCTCIDIECNIQQAYHKWDDGDGIIGNGQGNFEKHWYRWWR